MRCRFILRAAFGIVGVLIVAPGLWAQVSNAGHAPETPAPTVRPGPWRGVGTVTPCVLPWGGIYACPPAPTTVAIRAGRMFDSLTGQMLTKQVVLVQGQRITAVGPDGTVTIPAGTQVIDLSQATVVSCNKGNALSRQRIPGRHTPRYDQPGRHQRPQGAGVGPGNRLGRAHTEPERKAGSW